MGGEGDEAVGESDAADAARVVVDAPRSTAHTREREREEPRKNQDLDQGLWEILVQRERESVKVQGFKASRLQMILQHSFSYDQ